MVGWSFVILALRNIISDLLFLQDIVTLLRTKMSLFDPTNIDIVDTRLQVRSISQIARMNQSFIPSVIKGQIECKPVEMCKNIEANTFAKVVCMRQSFVVILIICDLGSGYMLECKS